MRLPELAIKNYQFTLILVILVLITGILSFINMPRSEDPALSLPNYSVVAVMPGTSVEDMEELIVNPIEEEINELDDIVKIKTRVEEGLMILQVEASYNVDIDDTYEEITTAVKQLETELPENLLLLEINKFNPEDVAIAQLAVVSESSEYEEMVLVAESVEKALSPIQGIKKTDLHAYPESLIEIAIDIPKMAFRNITIGQVIGVLKGNNQNIPGGSVNAGTSSFSVTTTGSYHDLAAIEETIVGVYQGSPVYLRDVASVRLSYDSESWTGRYNGKKALFISVSQKSGSNILQVTDEMLKRLEPLKKELSTKDIQLEVGFLQAPDVNNRINNFFSNLLQGILLVGLVILLFLGARPAIIITTVIPISVLIAITLLDYNDFGIQQISIAGLVIALGLLVDNGIVVIENIVRLRGEGLSLTEASIKGTTSVSSSIISSTITTVLAFFPLTQLGGGTGEFLKSLPLTVIFALLASLVLALILTPILSNKILQKNKLGRDPLPGRLLDLFSKRFYEPILLLSLKRPYALIGITVIMLAGSFALFPKVGVSFFPTADKPMLLVDIETPGGSNRSETDKAVRFVESLLDSSDYVSSWFSNTGHGNPQVYYNRIPENYRQNYGQVMINLSEWNQERFYRFLSSLRKATNSYPYAEITITELKNGPPFLAPIEIKVLGEKTDTLKKYASIVEEIIRNTDGTMDVNNPYTREKVKLKVDVNKEKASYLGLQWTDIDASVAAAINGITVDKTTLENNREYPLQVRFQRADNEKKEINDLNKVYIGARSGSLISLNHIADFSLESGLMEMDHFQTLRAATVTANVINADNTAIITERIIEKLDSLQFPNGYQYYVAGEYETQQSSFGELGLSLVVALIGIFAVLVFQFKSISQPVIVFSAIPFAFIGSIVTLYLTGWSFSFFAFVGFTSLVGIVVNNSIILVDYINQLQENGKERMEAIIEAGRTRFKPIFLTSITSILGLLPLTLGNTNLWSPLGWTIIGGMISSTVLVIFLVPVFYSLIVRSDSYVSPIQ